MKTKIVSIKADSVHVTDYNPLYNSDFVQLNKEWITRYFELEDEDYKIFANPEKIILDGGNIFFALYDGKAIGTVALIREDDGRKYEISKMAVSPEYRGCGIGEKLLKHAIKYAADHYVKYLYLISNTQLTPAIKLYEKLGFKRIYNEENTYKRGDYMAELWLSQA